LRSSSSISSGFRDAHAVVQLVLLLEPAQDRDRLLDARLGDEDRLEAAHQRRVLLQVLAVLVERGGADAMQVAAGERRLEHVGGVDRALGLAGADQGVQLVDEDDDLALGGRDFLEHGLQALLELAAELGAGHQGAQVERHQAPVLEGLGHVAVDDALGQALDDGGLADAGLADQHGVVLGPAREHLDGAPDLLVAADDRVELARARGRGQVLGVLLERLVAVLGRGAVGLAALAQLLDRRLQLRRRGAGLGQRFGRGRAARHGQRQEQAFGGDEAVANRLGQLLGLLQDARQIAAQIGLAGARALDLGQLGERRLDRVERARRIAAGRLDQVRGQALAVVQEGLEQVLGGDLLMVGAQCEALGGLEEPARALGVLVEFHVFQPSSPAPALRGGTQPTMLVNDSLPPPAPDISGPR
jgi:hypothetical protein